MRIAITGGTGLLGRYFVRRLIEHGLHTPIILSRNKIKLLFNAEVRVTDYSVSSLTDVLEEVDAVVHLAAQRGNSANLADYYINTDITQDLYAACNHNKIMNIIYASTISVYSQEDLLPWCEEQPTAPVSMYGISKLACEYIGGIYTRQYALNVKNLRFAHLFGCNEKNDYMINKFMRQAFQKSTLILYSKSSAKREFLYAKDAALAMLNAVEEDTLCGTFNVGSGEALTNQEVAVNINRAFNNNENLQIDDRNDKAIKSSFLSSEKAKSLLGYKAQYSFYEAMEDIYKEIKNV